jgi:hypothetical protein
MITRSKPVVNRHERYFQQYRKYNLHSQCEITVTGSGEDGQTNEPAMSRQKFQCFTISPNKATDQCSHPEPSSFLLNGNLENNL